MTNNQVILSGRVSDVPVTRELPSGDVVTSFRLIVRRSVAAQRTSRQIVDTFECTAWTKRLQTRVRKLAAGDEVTVTGALRRRFSRASGAPVSFVSIELGSIDKTAAEAS